MILVKLKEATKPAHSRLEMTVDLLNSALDLESYQNLLLKFYGFYAPVEPQLLRVIKLQSIDFDYEARLKVPLLTGDLRNLNGENFDFDTVEICGDAPALDTFAQTLGCLYVLEGATLGGQIISRSLKRNLNLTAENGAAFFNGYGERTGQMWKAFGAMANAQAETFNRDEEIIASAQETFAKFEKWMTADNLSSFQK